MIFAFALALQWISIPSASGFFVVDDTVIFSNEVILRDGSAASSALGELRSVADIRAQAERKAPASNTHEDSPDNSFVSYDLELFPAAGGGDSGEWAPQDGSINPDLLAASPDHVALQNTLWDSWLLGVAFTLTGEEGYRERGSAILETTFAGAGALLPNMQYARLIPQGSIEDARSNPLGFQEMNDVGLALGAAALLDLSPTASSSFDIWMGKYVEWLVERLSTGLQSMQPIDRLWYHTQQASIFKHLGNNARLDQQCSQLRTLFPSILDEDGRPATDSESPTPAAALLNVLHALEMAAVACVGSGADLWDLSASGSPSDGYIRRAASAVISSTEGQRVELLPLSAGRADARRASLSLALLYTETGREGASELMLRLLAANPDFQASLWPLAISTAVVPADDVDGAGEPRWAGYLTASLTCEDLDAASLPCEEVSRGFDWGGAGGVVVALVLALLPFAVLALLFWWLRRRRGAPTRSGHEIKSHETDNSMDDMSLDAKLEDDKLGGSPLEVTKVQVDPYEPDGYDPNNVKKILGDLTTGEQVIKAKELKQKLMGGDPRDPQHELVSAPSDMHGELGPVASGMSGGHSTMSARAHAMGGQSSFLGGASGTAFSMSPSHSLMGTQSMGATASPMAARTQSGKWQAERTSSGQMARKHGHPSKHSSSSRHGHSQGQSHGHSHGHSPQYAAGGSSHMSSRHRSSGYRRGATGASAPMVAHGSDRRTSSGNRQRHRTHTLGAPMQQHPQQRRHGQHRSSRSHPQQRRRGPGKGGAEGKALLELDQALNALQNAVKPSKRPSQRKVRPTDPRVASRSRGSSRRHSSRGKMQQPSVAEAHAKVLSAIDSRLRAASALLANASKPRAKPKEKEDDDGAVSDVPVLENDDGVLPISAADGCVEGPRGDRVDASDGSSSAGELSFTLPAAQGEPDNPKQTLQLAGFQWLYTSDDTQSAEALRESIAVVQRQIKENPEIVAKAAAAALDPSDSGALAQGGDGAEGAAGADGGGAAAEGDAEKQNAYAVVAALMATVRAEAAAEAERCESEGYGSSDDGEEALAAQDSQVHGGASDDESDAGSDAGSHAGSQAGSHAGSGAGSVMEFASAAGDSAMCQGEESMHAMDTLNLHPPGTYATESLLTMHAGVVEEEDEEGSSSDAPHAHEEGRRTE